MDETLILEDCWGKRKAECSYLDEFSERRKKAISTLVKIRQIFIRMIGAGAISLNSQIRLIFNRYAYAQY
jgi:hypothetical protein